MGARNEFRKSIAVIVGVAAYGSGVPQLRTAVNDARRLGQLLADEHDYAVRLLLDERATGHAILELLVEELPAELGPEDRVLFYFAGHGVALEGAEGPSGYLVPQDARRGDAASYLPMPAFYEALAALPCRHLLAILDCCFAGAFRWSSTRDMMELPEVIYRERFDRFVLDPAWQAIASASHDQKALDRFPHNAGRSSGELRADFGTRGEEGDHSPFALALFDALAGAGDVVPADGGDGIITATELYLYLESRVQPATIGAGHRQTPRLWPLQKHDKGEYVFFVPGHELNLPPAPEVTYENNPWRGLEPYEKGDAKLFFGRERVVKDLACHVEGHPLTVVLGASGTGKSSVVRAGLLPQLRSDVARAWSVLPVVRPGAEPLLALNEATDALGAADEPEMRVVDSVPAELEERIARRIDTWCAAHPDARLVLIVDQFEELVTMTRHADERQAVLGLLARLVEAHPERLRLVLTLRSDFEPQFDRTQLGEYWRGARYVVPPMTQADLRAVIERPASERAVYFHPAGLIDDLIDEVVQTPGGLPLLSFALSEMYRRYVDRYAAGGTTDRALEASDYDAVGGVVGALRSRAEAEYEALDAAHRESMRRAMLRMVAVEGGTIARRRVPRSELEYPDDAETARVRAVVRRLTAARLVVKGREGDGEPYIEPAHDALVRAWDRLLGWIHAEEDQAANLRFQQNVARTARDWEQAEDRKAKAGLLWRDAVRGGLLAQLVRRHEGQRRPGGADQTRHEGESAWMNRRELAFARRSIRRRSLIRLGMAGLLLLIVAGAVTSVSFGVEAGRQEGIAADSALVAQEQRQEAQRQAEIAADSARVAQEQRTIAINQATLARRNSEEAERQKQQADRERDIALSRAYSARALSALNRDPLEALILAIEAGRTQTFEANQVLRRAIEAPRVEMIIGHEETVWHAAFSPDGTRLVTASSDGTARIWDPATGEELAALTGHGGELWHEKIVFHAAFSPDGRRVVTASSDRTARVWDAASGDLLAALTGHEASVWHAAFSPDGTRLVTASDDGTARIWDPASGDLLAALTGHGGELWHEKNVLHAAFSPDGRRVVTASTDRTARVWDAASGDLLAALTGHEKNVLHAAFSPDGRRVVTASDDGTARIWDAASGDLLAALTGHEGELTHAAFSPDGRRVVTASDDGTARIWDPASGDLLAALTGHGGELTHAAFSPDGRRVVTASTDRTARVWDAASGDLLAALTGHGGELTHAAFNPDGRRVVTASDDGTARVWDPASGDLLTALTGHESWVVNATFSPDGRRVVTASTDRTARIWDAASGDLLAALTGHEKNVWHAAFSPDGRRVVTASDDGTARIWDPASGDLLAALTGHESWVVNATFSPDGRRVVTASRDSTARIWDAASGDLLAALTGHGGELTHAAFSPDGRRVVTASDDGTARIWDPASGDLLAALTGHGGELTHAAFSPDGRRVVTASDDGTARIWDPASGDLLAALTGHGGELWHEKNVLHAAFSPDGRRVVTASSDGTARVWDAASGDVLAALTGHRGVIWHAAFSPDGRRVVTAGSDGTARVWDAASGDVFAALAGHEENVWHAAFSPDGRRVVTASDDGTARVFITSFIDLVAIAESRLPVSFTDADRERILGR